MRSSESCKATQGEWFFLLWVIGGIYSTKGYLGVGGDRGSRPSASHTLHSQLPCFFFSSSPKPLFDCKILILLKFLLIFPPSPLVRTPPPPPLYFTSPTSCTLLPSIRLALVFKRFDSAIHWINCYSVDECKAIQLPYLVDSTINLLINWGLGSYPCPPQL